MTRGEWIMLAVTLVAIVIILWDVYSTPPGPGLNDRQGRDRLADHVAKTTREACRGR